MAYGQTGSGKTDTMLGPPGALTEASLDQAAGVGGPGASRCSWPVMLELLRAPELAGARQRPTRARSRFTWSTRTICSTVASLIKVGSAKEAPAGTLVVADIGKAPVWSGDVQIVGGVHPSGCSCFKCFQKTGGLVGGSRLKKQLHAASGGAGRGRHQAGGGSAAVEQQGTVECGPAAADRQTRWR